MENRELQEPTKNLSLEKIVRSFGIGINEEQAWAVIHQALVYLRAECEKTAEGTRTNPVGSPLLSTLLLDKDGCVSVVEEMEGNNCQDGFSLVTWIEDLACTVFEACQFGLAKDKEANLSGNWDALFDLMVPEVNNPANPVDWIEPGSVSEDETASTPTRQNVSLGSRCPSQILAILQKTSERCKNFNEACEHYQAVCRALFVECIDLLEFLRRVKDPQNDSVCTEVEVCAEWVKLWMQVVGQLRKGVQLRKIESVSGDEPLLYELTPYEMLMEDIKMKRFNLKNTPPKSERAQRKLDRHEMILEYIRSRPPLAPAENRILPPPKDTRGPIEILMDSIRRFEPCHLNKTPPCTPKKSAEMPSDSNTVVGDSTHKLVMESLAVPKRKLILPDEDSYEPIDFHFQQEDGKSSGQCESRMSDFDDDSERSKRTCADVISLRLDEIALIRGALAKAELENLEDQDMALCTQIRRAEVCYSCHKTRFRWFLGKPGVKCHLCQNMVCASCTKKMHLPCDRLECIPVYTLSPSSDPEDEEEIVREDDYPFQKSNTRPNTSASTLPRQRVQRSQSHDYSLTLPKAQPKKRAALQRGLTLTPFRDSASMSPSQKSPSPPLPKTFSRKQQQTTKDVVVEVCLVCHNVLLHAIIESQTQLQSIYHENGNLFLQQTAKSNAIFRSSNSSVVSGSGSDSLDEDFEGEETGDERKQPSSKGLRSISPDLSLNRSHSTAEVGSFFTSHI